MSAKTILRPVRDSAVGVKDKVDYIGQEHF